MYKVSDKKNKYLEQWERVKRWYKRIQKIKEQCPKGYSDDDCLDEIYAFFINCFHLKDWIKNSKPEYKEAIENLFDKNKGKEVFKVCADLVNNSKHLKIKKNRNRIDPNTQVTKQHTTVQTRKSLTYSVLGEKNNKQKSGNNQKNNTYLPSLRKYSWEVTFKDKSYDIYDLANKCFEEWQRFLKDEELV